MKIGERGIVSFSLQQGVGGSYVGWFGHSMARGVQREEGSDLLRGISGWVVLVMPGRGVCSTCGCLSLMAPPLFVKLTEYMQCPQAFTRAPWLCFLENSRTPFTRSPRCLMRGIMAPKDMMTNTHAKSILNSMNSLRKSNTLCDVTLRVEQQDFPAHRIVLAACSDYFCAMFTSEVRGGPAPDRWSPHRPPRGHLIPLNETVEVLYDCESL